MRCRRNNLKLCIHSSSELTLGHAIVTLPSLLGRPAMSRSAGGFSMRGGGGVMLL